MILPSDLKELEFECIEKVRSIETWTYEAKIGVILFEFRDYQKTVRLFICDSNYKEEVELKCEPTEERIINLIKALS